jgi:hypothetical protein
MRHRQALFAGLAAWHGSAMEILQTRLPYRPWSDPGLSRLPGLMPVPEGE